MERVDRHVDSSAETSRRGDIRRRAARRYAVEATKEYDACAGRGACDAGEGECECFTSNFELFASSDLYGGPGLHGDCGYPLTDVTLCPGAEDATCSGNGVCRGKCRDGNADGRCEAPGGRRSRRLRDGTGVCVPEHLRKRRGASEMRAGCS